MAASSTKEQLFEAWRQWDLELDNLQRKKSAKERLNALIDKYKAETKSGAARVLVKMWLRDEYAKWRTRNG